MARSVNDIQTQMLSAIAADPVLGPLLTSVSSFAIYRLFTFIVAAAIAILEQFIDVFTANTEAKIAAGAAASEAWLQAQAFLFQYSTTSPQIAQLATGPGATYAWFYPTVNPALRVVTQCAVTTDLAGIVTIKVAGAGGALTSGEVTALQDFYNTIGTAGITYSVVSLPADELYVQAIVFYVGQFSDVISADVIAAITTFLTKLPFNGTMKVSDLLDAIKSVPGVTDCILQNVSARADATAFGSGTGLVVAQAWSARIWPSVAGYMIPETTSGQTLDSTLTFTSDTSGA